MNHSIGSERTMGGAGGGGEARYSLREGDMLGPYRVNRPLGRGGMGEVYLAEHQVLRHQVALKIIRPEFSSEPSFQERFAREGRCMANLHHFNIVSCSHAGFENGLAWLAMDYVGGPDGQAMDLRRLMEERWRDSRPFTEEEVIGFGLQMCEALDHAHKAVLDGVVGVVHRDLKPANILVNADGRLRITDFGLARMVGVGSSFENSVMSRARPAPRSLGDAATAASPRSPGATASGTPIYMSPEQRDGNEGDGRSDLYAVGAILYELLTGRKVAGRPVAPSKARPGISRTWDTILLRHCLAQSPQDRYPSAGDLRAALLKLRGATGRKRRVVLLAIVGVACLFAICLGWFLIRDGAGSDRPPGARGIGQIANADGPLRSKARLSPIPIGEAASPVPASGVSRAEIQSSVSGEKLGREAVLRKEYDQIISETHSAPASLAIRRDRMRSFATRASGSKFEALALTAATDADRALKFAAEAKVRELKNMVQSLIAGGRAEDAALLIESYTGPLAAETSVQRAAEAAIVRKEARARKESGIARRATTVRNAKEAAARALVRSRPAEAITELDRALAQLGVPVEADLSSWRELSVRAASVPRTVMSSFEGDVGKWTTIRTISGVLTGRVIRVDDLGIDVARTATRGSVITNRVAARELTEEEQGRRLVAEPERFRNLLAGLIWLQAGDTETACRLFLSNGGEIGQQLNDHAREVRGYGAGSTAQTSSVNRAAEVISALWTGESKESAAEVPAAARVWIQRARVVIESRGTNPRDAREALDRALRAAPGNGAVRAEVEALNQRIPPTDAGVLPSGRMGR